jgi:hypothetical protein
VLHAAEHYRVESLDGVRAASECVEDTVLRDGVSLDGQLDPRAIDEAREEGVVAPQDDAGIRHRLAASNVNQPVMCVCVEEEY